METVTIIQSLKASFDMLKDIMQEKVGYVRTPPPHDQLNELLLPQIEQNNYFGEWSRHRLLFHLMRYEYFVVNLVLPRWEEEMKNPPDPEVINQVKEHWKSEEDLYSSDLPIKDIVEQFWALRQEQINYLEQCTPADLQETRLSPGMGIVTLQDVYLKTIQHSYEHGNKMLRLVLFWEKPIGMFREAFEDLNDISEDTRNEITSLMELL